MKIGMRRLQLFILLFAASSLLFQLPSEAFASTPSDITAKDKMTDTGSLELDDAHAVETFTIDSSTYAIVVSFRDDGVQIIDPEPEMDPEPEIEMDPEPEQTKKEKSKRQRR